MSDPFEGPNVAAPALNQKVQFDLDCGVMEFGNEIIMMTSGHTKRTPEYSPAAYDGYDAGVWRVPAELEPPRLVGVGASYQS